MDNVTVWLQEKGFFVQNRVTSKRTTIKEIILNHCLEHLDPEELFHLLTKLYFILRVGSPINFIRYFSVPSDFHPCIFFMQNHLIFNRGSDGVFYLQSLRHEDFLVEEIKKNAEWVSVLFDLSTEHKLKAMFSVPNAEQFITDEFFDQLTRFFDSTQQPGYFEQFHSEFIEQLSLLDLS